VAQNEAGASSDPMLESILAGIPAAEGSSEAGGGSAAGAAGAAGEKKSAYGYSDEFQKTFGKKR